jgi:hypothetical protein
MVSTGYEPEQGRNRGHAKETSRAGNSAGGDGPRLGTSDERLGEQGEEEACAEERKLGGRWTPVDLLWAWPIY